MAKFKKGKQSFRPIATVLQKRRRKLSTQFLSAVRKMRLWNEYIIKEVQDKQQYKHIFISGQYDDDPLPESQFTSRFDLNVII